MIRCTLTERGVAFDGIDLLYLGKSTWRNAIIFGVDSYNVKRSENKNNDFLIKSIEPSEVGDTQELEINQNSSSLSTSIFKLEMKS